jgi:calcium permeable stress-gated cation channel
MLSPEPLPSSPIDWLDLINDASSYLTIQLLFTYLFALLALRFIYLNYRKFIRSRQLFSLELVHSIPARTVMISDLPTHLQGERPLAEYFENMGLSVESVTVCREVETLKKLLDMRTKALLSLEAAWVKYVGNPSSVESYDPSENALPLLGASDPAALEEQPGRLVVPHHPRPTLRTGWFKPKIDALEYLERQFKEADELVKKRRTTGRFKATQSAFVTFEKMSSAVGLNFQWENSILYDISTANCHSNGPCPQSPGVYDLSRPGTTRHCLVQHDLHSFINPYS